MERICPKCSNKLQPTDNYFCSNCGEKLPEELIFVSNNVRVKKYVPTEKSPDKELNGYKKTNRINKNLIFVFLLLIIIGGSLTFILKSGIVKLILSETSVGVKLENNVSKIIDSDSKEGAQISLNLSLPTLSFGKKEFPNHIPSSVSFYFEGTSLTDVLKLSLFDPDNEELRNAAKLVLEPEFSGFLYKDEEDIMWGFLFTPKDSRIAEELLADKLGDKWEIAFISDYIVVANDLRVFDQVKSVDANLIPSLSKNPEFLTLRKHLALEGQFQLCFLNEDARDDIRNTMSGFNVATIGMISEILNTDQECLVISNQHE